MNAIVSPSGDQDADRSRAELYVSLRTSEPSALIVYTSKLPSRSESKLIRPPSGENDG